MNSLSLNMFKKANLYHFGGENGCPGTLWRLRVLVGIITLMVALLLSPALSLALPSNDPGNPDSDELACLPVFKVSGQPRMTGFPLVGQKVTIEAAHVKLINTNPFCSRFQHALNSGDFLWQFTMPSGSAGVVEAANSLQPRVELDVGGPYMAQLTVCPTGCTVITDGPGDVELPFEVPKQPAKFVFFVTSPVLPPEKIPLLTDSAKTNSGKTRSPLAERDEKCLNSFPRGYGPGFLDPQWVTREEFSSPWDYAGGEAVPNEIRAVEGVVMKSKVSRKDGPLNHHTQDFNFHVKPDPAHNSFLLHLDDHEKIQELLGIEWEVDDFTSRYFPSNGDRVSVFGYWIHDCGHRPWVTEIHPPIGVAVHRPRAIPIPEDPGDNIINWPGGSVGTNIYVPGILTEIYFNPYAGKMMDCKRTGLHQPGRILPPLPGQPFSSSRPIAGDCIEQPSPIAGPFYTFNIYLPRNPKLTLEAAVETDLPEIPLYYEVIDDGPFPLPVEIEPRTENGVTYLHVRVDLRSFTGQTNMRQTLKIASAWVYPSQDNWGLHRWRIKVKSLDVHNDSDGYYRGKGEWNMWFHVNNASQDSSHHEWTKIINKSVTDHTFEIGSAGQPIQVGPPLTLDFDGRPWSTGSDADQDRRLGPDLLLFPGQMIQAHTSGFEKDFYTQDSLALVDELRPQIPGTFSSNNICKKSIDIDSLIYSGCADYDLNFEIIDRGFVPGAVLSDTTQELMDAYTFDGTAGCQLPPGDDVCQPVIVVGDLPTPVPDEPWHPQNVIVEVNAPPASIHETSLFKPQGFEEFVLTEISIGRFYDAVTARQETIPEDVRRMLTQLRAAVDEALVSVGSEVLLDVRVICAALPQDLCQEYFGDLPNPEVPNDATRRSMTGSGKIKKDGRTSINLTLYCNPMRRPNKLMVKWGKKHNFKMDLLTSAKCEEAPDTMRTHSGWALGRLDGAPGAKVNWTFVDAGEPGKNDHVRLVVYNAENEIVHTVEGKIDEGNLQAH